MANIGIQFSNLEVKILDVLENYNHLKQKTKDLNEAIEKSTNKIREQTKLINKLEQENKTLKVANAISGNDEYKRIMKVQINRMIKEIDLCITEISNG